MTNYERYLMDISNGVRAYHITISQFEKWLEKDYIRVHEFFNDLDKNIAHEKGLYDIALDYSIPVILVKYMQKRYNLVFNTTLLY